LEKESRPSVLCIVLTIRITVRNRYRSRALMHYDVPSLLGPVWEGRPMRSDPTGCRADQHIIRVPGAPCSTRRRGLCLLTSSVGRKTRFDIDVRFNVEGHSRDCPEALPISSDACFHQLIGLVVLYSEIEGVVISGNERYSANNGPLELWTVFP